MEILTNLSYVVGKFLVAKNCVVMVICLFRKGVTNVITMLCLLIYLLRPIAPGGAQAIDNPSPANLNLGFSFSFFPVVSYMSFSSALVPSPTVSGVFLLSLPLGIPPQSLPVGWCCLVLSAVWPIQPHFLLKICWPTGCCSPRCQSSVLIASFLRPPNAKDASQGSIKVSFWILHSLLQWLYHGFGKQISRWRGRVGGKCRVKVHSLQK